MQHSADVAVCCGCVQSIHVQAMRDKMEEIYKQWHTHTEQQLAAHIQAAEDKAVADLETQQRRCALGLRISHAMC